MLHLIWLIEVKGWIRYHLLPCCSVAQLCPTLLTPCYLILIPNPSTSSFGSKFKQLPQSPLKTSRATILVYHYLSNELQKYPSSWPSCFHFFFFFCFPKVKNSHSSQSNPLQKINQSMPYPALQVPRDLTLHLNASATIVPEHLLQPPRSTCTSFIISTLREFMLAVPSDLATH